jgi:hypothetical protein
MSYVGWLSEPTSFYSCKRLIADSVRSSTRKVKLRGSYGSRSQHASPLCTTAQSLPIRRLSQFAESFTPSYFSQVADSYS